MIFDITIKIKPKNTADFYISRGVSEKGLSVYK